MDKIHKATKLLQSRRKFFIYTVIGMSGVLLDLLIFFVLFNLIHLEKNLANAISTSAGITNNFIWNVFLNFKVKDKLFLRFITFYCVGLTGIVITSVMFWIGVDNWHINANVVKFASIFVVLVWQFNLNKLLSFRSFQKR